MLIDVKVKPSAKKPGIVKISEKEFNLAVKASPQDGKANQDLIKMLSVYFDIPKSMIIIVRGLNNRNKVVEIASLKS